MSEAASDWIVVPGDPFQDHNLDLVRTIPSDTAPLPFSLGQWGERCVKLCQTTMQLFNSQWYN